MGFLLRERGLGRGPGGGLGRVVWVVARAGAVVAGAPVVAVAGVEAAVVVPALWVGAEAAVTVVVVEPQAASGAAQQSASTAAADARRRSLFITSILFAAGCRTPRSPCPLTGS